MVEEDKPIGEMVGRLIDDGKAYAQAEFDLVRTRLEIKIDGYRASAAFAGIALLFGLAALVALAVTAVLALATLIGPLGGGLAATLLFAIIAGAFAYAARQRLGQDDE